VTAPAVWAPKGDRVELVTAEGRRAMEPGAGGWWSTPRDLPPGTDYGFALDGGEPLPDPRSAWQPAGVNGLSRALDHAAFGWTDAGFRAPELGEAVLYELHVGTFSHEGTFDGAARHLDQLVALGVTHVELMPIAEFSGDRGWGYDGVDLFAPHHAYGRPDGFKRLVDAAHARGLAVLLDVVYNHLGPEGNHLDRFGPYFTDRYATPWGRAVNFDDAGSDEVRRFVIDNALMWLRDYHVDGLRLDAVHAMFDGSATHILEELAEAVHVLGAALGRPLVVIAESDLNDPRLVRSPEDGGYGLDAAWADDFHHAVHAALTGEADGYYADFTDPDALARAVCTPYLYAGTYSAYRDRRHGRDPGDLPGHRFVVALQNHDQVGNRARGERIGHLVSEGRARIGAALLLTAPYVPLVFAGEEWSASSPFRYFTGHESADLAEAVRAGRRAEFASFGWDPDLVPDPQDPGTFEVSRLPWEERSTPAHAAMLDWYRELIALRRRVPALRDADRRAVRVQQDAAAGWIRVDRGPVEILANLGEDPVALPVSARLLLAWPPEVAVVDGRVTLPPDGVLVSERPA